MYSTILQNEVFNALCVAPSSHNVFFTGDSAGNVFRWERSSANPYFNTREQLHLLEMRYSSRRQQPPRPGPPPAREPPAYVRLYQHAKMAALGSSGCTRPPHY